MSTIQESIDLLKKRLDEAKRNVQLETTFLSRADCMIFIKRSFGLDENKNIILNQTPLEANTVREDGTKKIKGYRSSNVLFMKCDSCELFQLEARIVNGVFKFIKENCCLHHGNETNLPCTSKFVASKV